MSARSPATTKPPHDESSSTEPKADAKVPVNLRLPEASVLKLKLHSLAEGLTASEVVSRLIDDHLTKHELVTKEASL
jgi:hypothetical protein